jgi:hypothetical protein
MALKNNLWLWRDDWNETFRNHPSHHHPLGHAKAEVALLEFSSFFVARHIDCSELLGLTSEPKNSIKSLSNLRFGIVGQTSARIKRSNLSRNKEMLVGGRGWWCLKAWWWWRSLSQNNHLKESSKVELVQSTAEEVRRCATVHIDVELMNPVL